MLGKRNVPCWEGQRKGLEGKRAGRRVREAEGGRQGRNERGGRRELVGGRRGHGERHVICSKRNGGTIKVTVSRRMA